TGPRASNSRSSSRTTRSSSAPSPSCERGPALQWAMTFSAEFRCIAGCAGGYPLDEVIYRCPACGDLLEVVHDLEALRRARTADGWKQLFAERWRSVEEPWGSGVGGQDERVE